MKRYIVNRESDSECNFQLVEASSSERDRKDRKTSKPRSPNSLPLELLIESKAGGGVSKLITPGPISSYIYRSCLVTPLDQKSGFMRNSLVLFDQLAQNGYDLRHPGN
jgi:hypothetical protein